MRFQHVAGVLLLFATVLLPAQSGTTTADQKGNTSATQSEKFDILLCSRGLVRLHTAGWHQFILKAMSQDGTWEKHFALEITPTDIANMSKSPYADHPITVVSQN